MVQCGMLHWLAHAGHNGHGHGHSHAAGDADGDELGDGPDLSGYYLYDEGEEVVAAGPML